MSCTVTDQSANDEVTMAYIVTALQTNTTAKLYVSDCSMSDDRADSLVVNSYRSLFVNYNDTSDNGIASIATAHALRKNNTLKTLNIRGRLQQMREHCH